MIHTKLTHQTEKEKPFIVCRCRKAFEKMISLFLIRDGVGTRSKLGVKGTSQLDI